MTKAGKIWSVIAKVITWLIVAFALLVVLFTVLATLTVGKQQKAIFGYRAYIVLSDSMQDTFSAGDIVVSKIKKDVTDLEAGTIITFISADSDSYGETVTHKIREKTEINGHAAYITYGTTTGADDETPVFAENILGVYAFRLPKMGYFFRFVKTPWGYVTVILVPFLLLIGLNAAHFVKLLRAYNREKNTEKQLAAEQAAADREETLKLKAELEQLKARLSEANTEKAPSEGERADKEE